MIVRRFSLVSPPCLVRPSQALVWLSQALVRVSRLSIQGLRPPLRVVGRHVPLARVFTARTPCQDPRYAMSGPPLRLVRVPVRDVRTPVTPCQTPRYAWNACLFPMYRPPLRGERGPVPDVPTSRYAMSDSAVPEGAVRDSSNLRFFHDNPATNWLHPG